LRGQSARAADIVKRLNLTRLGHRTLIYEALHNGRF
jgi:hypothetical protein